jgi:hypothetical protein
MGVFLSEREREMMMVLLLLLLSWGEASHTVTLCQRRPPQ